MAFTLADDNEISAYVEDVRAFIDVIKHETAVLHSADIAFFREYLISLGATISAPETESQASSSIAAALSEDNIEDVQIFIELIQVDDTGALHTTDLAFFREYLISLGATVPAPKSTEPEHPSDGAGGGNRESQAERLRAFLPRAHECGRS